MSALVGAADLLGLLRLEDYPERVAIVATSGPITRGELLSRVDEQAAVVRDVVPPGARVAMIDSGDEESIVTVLAGWRAGRSVAMLPVASPDDPAIAHRAVAAGCTAVAYAGGVRALAAGLAEGAPDARDGTELGGADEVLVLYTSGTTSEPKGVRLSARNLLSNLTAMLRTAVDWGEGDAVGQGLPVTHSFGMSMTLLGLITRVPLVLLDDGPPSRRTAQTMADHHVTVLGCVPYYLRLLAKRSMVPGSTFGPDLRRLYLAGGGIGDAELDALTTGYTGRTHLMYGFTEHTARVAVRRRGDGAPADSVGLPLPGTTVEVVGEDGEVLPVGAEGRIRATSPCLMIGYVGDPPREPGSPFTTTDLGRLDAAGHLTVTGRVAEMMNFRGNRVSVVRIEADLRALDGVRDARVTPDARTEDAQCAVALVAEDGADETAIRKAVIRGVEPKGIVREVSFTDRLEVTRSGKPLRR